jgi:hypothetical protein
MIVAFFKNQNSNKFTKLWGNKMKTIVDLSIQAEMEKIREWLQNERMEELAVLVNKMPEQRFVLSKKGRLIDAAEGDNTNFVVDGEMASYQEVDGQYGPVFEPIREVIKLEIWKMKEGEIKVHGKIKEMPRLTEKLEENLKGLSSRLLQAFPDVE